MPPYALYMVGPVRTAVSSSRPPGAGVALFFDAFGALILLTAVLMSVPRAAADADALRRPQSHQSGWRNPAPPASCRAPSDRGVLLQLLLHANRGRASLAGLPRDAGRRRLRPGSHVGCAQGFSASSAPPWSNQLRQPSAASVYLIAIIGLWAMCPIALAFVGNLTVAMIVFGLGGLVWAPFTPVHVQASSESGLEPDEQQQVVTLWATGSMVAAPLGLTAGGPLIELAGSTESSWAVPVD